MFSNIRIKVSVPKVHKGPILSLHVNLKREIFLTGGQDGYLKFFNLQNGVLISQLYFHKSALYKIL